MSPARKIPAEHLHLKAVALIVLLCLAISPGCAGLRDGQPPSRASSPASGSSRSIDSVNATPDRSTTPSVPIAGPGGPGADLSRALGSVPGGSQDQALRRTSDLVEPALPSPSIPPSPGILPIDLPAALRLADKANPVIGEARARIGEALGVQLQARVLLLPTLNGGVSYDGHSGVLQQSDGRVIKVYRQSLYLGGGAYSVASSTVSVPAVNVSAHLGDAIFNPLAASQEVDVVRLDASATANSVLLGVAVEYLELQAAANDLAARRRTEAEAAEIARITAQYAKTGQGRQADADRAETQKQLRRGEIRRAEERLAVASARLARRLHLDPSATIEPVNKSPEVFALIEPDVAPEVLIETAVRNRPEVKARSAGIAVAETRARQERARPFLPTVWLGYSAAGFGGGSNLTPPLLGNLGARTDFDAYAYWTLLNFGAGNLAIIKRQEAQVGQAVAERDRAINLVREEVASARAEALARREKLRIAVEELAIAQDGYRKDLERIQQAAGPPLEVLNNLRLLRLARESLIEAVLGYNQAQFQLFVAMGSPPPPELPSHDPLPAPAIEALSALPSRLNGAASLPTVSSPDGSTGDNRAIVGSTDRDGLSTLDRAKKAATGASADYDRLQAELFQALQSDEKRDGRGEMVGKVAGLAEAHRKEVLAKVEYDKVLWSLITNSKNPAPERPEQQASRPPGP